MLTITHPTYHPSHPYFPHTNNYTLSSHTVGTPPYNRYLSNLTPTTFPPIAATHSIPPLKTLHSRLDSERNYSAEFGYFRKCGTVFYLVRYGAVRCIHLVILYKPKSSPKQNRSNMWQAIQKLVLVRKVPLPGSEMSRFPGRLLPRFAQDV